MANSNSCMSHRHEDLPRCLYIGVLLMEKPARTAAWPETLIVPGMERAALLSPLPPRGLSLSLCMLLLTSTFIVAKRFYHGLGFNYGKMSVDNSLGEAEDRISNMATRYVSAGASTLKVCAYNYKCIKSVRNPPKHYICTQYSAVQYVHTLFS